jgi:hypothetical protein
MADRDDVILRLQAAHEEAARSIIEMGVPDQDREDEVDRARDALDALGPDPECGPPSSPARETTAATGQAPAPTHLGPLRWVNECLVARAEGRRQPPLPEYRPEDNDTWAIAVGVAWECDSGASDRRDAQRVLRRVLNAFTGGPTVRSFALDEGPALEEARSLLAWFDDYDKANAAMLAATPEDALRIAKTMDGTHFHRHPAPSPPGAAPADERTACACSMLPGGRNAALVYHSPDLCVAEEDLRRWAFADDAAFLDGAPGPLVEGPTTNTDEGGGA